MLKNKLILIILALSCLNIFAADINKQTNKQLFILGKLYGIVVMYHPSTQLAYEKIDSTFINPLNKILKGENDSLFNMDIENLVYELHSIKAVIKKDKPFKYLPKDTTMNNLDFGWIFENNLLTPKNKECVFDIVRYYIPHQNRFFENEINFYYYNDISRFKYLMNHPPDVNGALLSVFKYWNYINYLHPYRKSIPLLWDNILYQFIPLITDVANSEDYYKIMWKLSAQINDCHSKFYNHFIQNSRYLPVNIDVISDKFYIKSISPYIKSIPELEPGDELKEINGISIYDLEKKYADYCSCGNEKTKRDELSILIKRVDTDTLNEVKVIHNKKEIISKLIVKREKESIKKTQLPLQIKNTFLNDSVYYMNLSCINEKVCREYIHKALQSKYLIFDCREFLNFRPEFILKYLLKKNQFVAHYYKLNYSFPGTFIYHKEFTKMGIFHSFNKKYKGKLILLMDETIISSGEWMIEHLKLYPNTITIGRNTKGADGTAVSIFLNKDILCFFTGDYFTDRNRINTQRHGITPDIYVKKDINMVEQGKDEIIERAIEIINKQ